MKSILPIIFVILVLTGGIVFTLSKRVIPQEPIDNLGIPANELESDIITPTPTESRVVTFGTLVTITPTPTVTPTLTMPEITEIVAKKDASQAKSTAQTTVTKTQICTPVYGSADTCTEHIVVDTGAESAMFFNFAGLAYIGGLLSFVKAKSLKK